MASTTRKSAAKAPTKNPSRTAVAAPAAAAPAATPPAAGPQTEASAQAPATGAKAAAPRPVKAPIARSPKPAGKKAGSAKPVKVPKAVTVAKPPKAAKGAKPVKEEKVKKAKLVRDSFTIPKPEYMVLEQLKQRATQLGAPIKKSELLRAGIKALAAMDSVDYLAALAAVPAIKTGRPAKA
ncbi:MAG: hypothetical protein H6930_05980 [Rhodoferax sp.]|jgi:hypothetical protein|nr:hypothetical protein [Rhodoferax sp.]